MEVGAVFFCFLRSPVAPTASTLHWAILDMVIPAHFLSQVGLLFEVRWGMRGIQNAQIPPDFGEWTLSNRKQKVSRITGAGGGRGID